MLAADNIKEPSLSNNGHCNRLYYVTITMLSYSEGILFLVEVNHIAKSFLILIAFLTTQCGIMLMLKI